MNKAYGILGLLFAIVLIGAYVAFERTAQAPEEAAQQNEEALPANEQTPMSLILTSPAFEPGGLIPEKYTCDAENISPELRIENAPAGTESFVLVMDDPDIPQSVKESRGIEKFDHWAIYNIPGDTTRIPENMATGTAGLNGAGAPGYTGPCPPDGEHRYIFRLYALSGTLNFVAAPTLDELEAAAKSMMIESAELVGRYDRNEPRGTSH